MCPSQNPSPDPRRQAVVAEALTWLRTPWHHEGTIKGAGVDCGQFLIAVFAAVGLIAPIKTAHYPADWNLHRDEARFMTLLLEYADPVAQPLPGDIAMFAYGRQDAHGAIVTDCTGPTIIHAWRDEGMVTLSDLSASPIAERLTGYYRLKALAS